MGPSAVVNADTLTEVGELRLKSLHRFDEVFLFDNVIFFAKLLALSVKKVSKERSDVHHLCCLLLNG